MNAITSVVKAHLGSWTIRLGTVMAVVVAMQQFLPALQEFVHAVWPVADEWLVVAGMWIGRLIGFLKALSVADE